MSSFINKSGKKVAPKGAPRRRAGGPPAAPQAPSQPAIANAHGTPQPIETSIEGNGAQLPTPNATQTEKLASPSTLRVPTIPPPDSPPDTDSPGIPAIQSSIVQQSKPQALNEIPASEDSIATVTPQVQQDGAELPIITVSTLTRQGSATPLESADGSRATKRRRVEEPVDVVHTASTRTEINQSVLLPPEVVIRTEPSPAPHDSPSRDDVDVPEVVTSPIPIRRVIPAAVASADGPPVIHTNSRPRQSTLPAAESIVPYETPRQVGTSQNVQSSSVVQPSASEQPSTSTTAADSVSPNSRAKGSRKDQWQVTTPGDVVTGKGKRKTRKPVERVQVEQQPEASDDNQLAQPSIVTLAPKARKTRKDKGVKKVSKTLQAEGQSTGNSEGDQEPETPMTEPGTESAALLASAASKRLVNLQKRKAKQLAKNSALSKAIGRNNATTIDEAVAQSIEGGGRSRASFTRAKKTPNLPVSSQTPNRASTVGTDRASSIAATEVTEGGTTRKSRTKRAETPEENEKVFIVASKTSMWDLANRDTENRVGQKSEREKAMRQIDWAEVKIKRKAEEERMARQARGKRLQDEDYDPEDEGLDEDERLARAVARNKNKRPGLQITLTANGEHIIDEQSQMVDRQRIHDDELELLEEVEEDDLTKKFNVHTYVTWRRKDEDERVMVNEKWSWEQTEKFYDALASFGTDFMIISKLFPGKTRRHIKAKFVREERAEPERIRDALTGHAGGRRNGQGGWDLETFRKGAGLTPDAFLDPKKIEEELRRERVEREKEIEEQRAETKEEERQHKLARALNGEDELGSDGEPLSPGGVIRAAQAEARRKKLERLGEKKRKILEMAGGTEEIVESIEDD